MARRWEQLTQMSDEEVMELYADRAKYSSGGISFYHSELTRRMLKQSGDRMERLTWAIVVLTSTNVVLVAWALFFS